VLGALLSPDELRQLAEAHVAEARRVHNDSERHRLLACADTLIDLAETKTLLLHYEQRFFN
jgi:hypothetical protein